MTYDHRIGAVHRADLDRELDSLRTERALAAAADPRAGVLGSARRRAGRALISAGTALIGRDVPAYRVHRA
ncbi:MAG: hypothetical protein QOF49_1218 [Chloroflexota bacterium]|jgi:hypothetical protein|nr:hypothetical protein [Chloroflexota bacterium]